MKKFIKEHQNTLISGMPYESLLMKRSFPRLNPTSELLHLILSPPATANGQSWLIQALKPQGFGSLKMGIWGFLGADG